MQNSVLPIGAGAVDGVICLISESVVKTENGGIWDELCVLFLVQVEFWIRSLNELVAVLCTGSHLSDLGICCYS